MTEHGNQQIWDTDANKTAQSKNRPGIVVQLL
jgi:hypothetical protein